LLASITDVNGRPVPPDYRSLEDICGIKHNSIYVRYRDLVNQQIALGVPGLQPIGTRATEAAAIRSATVSFDAESTPLSTPTTETAPTATSSPVKTATRKRKRTSVEREDNLDDDNEDNNFAPSTSAGGKKAKPTNRLPQIAVPPRTSSRLKETPSFALAFDFDHGADLLAVDERHRFDRGHSSDLDGEGESDDEAGAFARKT
jgi:hypothetical protein